MVEPLHSQESNQSTYKSEKKRIGRRPSILVVLILIGTCLCVLFFANMFLTGFEQKDEWSAVTNEFMSAMASKDLNRAYALCSPQMQNEVSISELREFMSYPMFSLFDGYLNIEITGWNLTYTLEGRFVELNSVVTYEGGYIGTFEGVLKKEGDYWKLQSFYVTVPPEKIR